MSSAMLSTANRSGSSEWRRRMWSRSGAASRRASAGRRVRGYYDFDDEAAVSRLKADAALLARGS